MPNTRRLPRRVNVQGHPLKLYIDSYSSSCGTCRNAEGVAFRFGKEGGWVIPLKELEAIVYEAKAFLQRHS